MHHYGEGSTTVEPTEHGFEIAFTNKESGQKITMYMPRVGVHEFPDRILTLAKAREIAEKIAGLLRIELS